MPDKVGNSSKVFNYFQILQSSLYLTMPYDRICKEVRYGITFKGLITQVMRRMKSMRSKDPFLK